jgi:N-acetylmuramoyl-L-alanine amidase
MIISNPTSHINLKTKSGPASKLESLTKIPRFSDLNKKSRKKYIKYGIIAGNVLLVLIISIFIVTNRSASQTVRNSTLNSVSSTASSASNPLDQLSSAQIALTAAQVTGLPELTAVRNQADSDSLTLNVVPNDTISVAKPQIVATGLKSKQDIRHYTTVLSDTVSSLAVKFGVSADSIKWSNSLSGDTLPAGKQLSIPPVNGIVYSVKAGDTPASLASRYQADANQIISYNDAEINGLKPGEEIIIPNGHVAAPTVSYSPRLSVASFSPAYGYNGYDYGYCTWYVANRIAVPSNWGNANTWDNYARLSGWTVSSVPVAGAIAQSDAGWAGHVAVVEAVSSDGSMMKYSDMNGLAGWGRVGYSDWVPVSKFPHYIYH